MLYCINVMGIIKGKETANDINFLEWARSINQSCMCIYI
jgi:hypothetical protein